MFNNIDKSNKDIEHIEFSYENLKQIIDPETGERSKPAVGIVNVPPPTKSDVINGDRIEIRKIDSQYLCTAAYQRNINETTISKMNDNNLYPSAYCGSIVCHQKDLWNPNTGRKETFFKVVDGQHKVAANPGREQYVCVANTVPEDLCFTGLNDPKASSKATPTDLFHARSFRNGIEKNFVTIWKQDFDVKIERHPDHGRGKLKQSQKTPVKCYEIGETLVQAYNEALRHVTSRRGEKTREASISSQDEAFRIVHGVFSSINNVFGLEDLLTGGKQATCKDCIKVITKWVCTRFTGGQDGISESQIPWVAIESSWRRWVYSDKPTKKSVQHRLVGTPSLRGLKSEAKRVFYAGYTKEAYIYTMLECIFNAQLVEDRR